MIENISPQTRWLLAAVVTGAVIGASSAFTAFTPLALILAIGVAVLTLGQPVWAVLLLIITSLLDVQGATEVFVGVVMISASKIAVLLVVAVHTLRATLMGTPWLRLTPITWGIVAVLLSGIISVAASGSPGEALPVGASVLLLGIMVHIIDATLMPKDIEPLLRLLAITLTIMMIWTLLSTQAGPKNYYSLDSAWQTRGSGGLGDPNYWATCLLLLCPPLIGFLAYDKHPSSRWLLLVMIVALPVSIFQSLSRAGMIGFVLIAPGLIWLNRNRARLTGLAGLVLVASAPLFVNFQAALLRYKTLLNPSLELSLGHGSLRERTSLLYAGIDMFLQHPIMGTGLGTFQRHTADITVTGPRKVAHDTYLNVAAEQGLIGIALHLVIVVQIVMMLRQLVQTAETPGQYNTRIGLVLGFVGFAIMAVTLNLIDFNPLWLALALACAMSKMSSSQTSPAAA